MNRSLTGIGFNHNLPTLLIIFNIFKCMCLTTFYYDYNPLLNTVQLVVSEVLMFHESAEVFPSGDSYDISPGNNDTPEHITLVLVVIPTRKQLVWVEAAKEDCT